MLQAKYGVRYDRLQRFALKMDTSTCTSRVNRTVNCLLSMGHFFLDKHTNKEHPIIISDTVLLSRSANSRQTDERCVWAYTKDTYDSIFTHDFPINTDTDFTAGHYNCFPLLVTLMWTMQQICPPQSTKEVNTMRLPNDHLPVRRPTVQRKWICCYWSKQPIVAHFSLLQTRWQPIEGVGMKWIKEYTDRIWADTRMMKGSV